MQTSEADAPEDRSLLARARAAPACCALALVMLVLFALQARAGVFAVPVTGEALLAWGAGSGPTVFVEGELWRLLSGVFVHVAVWHLGLNLWALLQVGPGCERLLGTGTFIGAFALFGVAGSITSIAFYPLHVGAGASGALFGLMGLEFVMLLRRAEPLSEKERKRRMRSLLLSLVLTGIFVEAAALGSHAAHAGGLVAGLGFGLWKVSPAPAPARGAWARAGALGLLGVLLVLTGLGVSRYVRSAIAITTAHARLEAGASQEALASADEAVAAGVRLADAYLLRARAHEALFHIQESLADYAAVIAAGGDAAYARGRVCYLQALTDSATGVLEQCQEAARAEGSGGYSARIGLARVLLRRHQPQEALEAARSASSQYPGWGEPLVMEGWAQLELKNPELAQVAFIAAGASQHGAEAESLRGQAEVARRRGDLRAALALFDKLVQPGQPGVDQALADRSSIHYSAGDIAEALADLDRLAVLRPDWATVHNNRAWYLLAAGRAQEALVAAERALSLEPDNARIRGTRCWVREALGDRVGALEDCGHSSRNAPDSPTDTGMLALLEGAPLEQVQAHWEKAAESTPADRPLFTRTLVRVRQQRAQR
ncbi:rhomboid family intramembrane serine protease [Myxococcus landrumensis]|uniref:Rhomboid family intramembrane serine protease n=1 Tax=Myxococcus landrumensis TaxID=2813577 RepID=A0ABX7NAH4_9BACT|nr:rhomboid family intramembrane serine protease [Myxococcus landrumus]QSQ15486.1 rhomboid family intramembrane serine protease [Myxococcus landrumus]